MTNSKYLVRYGGTQVVRHFFFDETTINAGNVPFSEMENIGKSTCVFFTRRRPVLLEKSFECNLGNSDNHCSSWESHMLSWSMSSEKWNVVCRATHESH